MSEWTEDNQAVLLKTIDSVVSYSSMRERALACVRLCAGHADLANVRVVHQDDLDAWKGEAEIDKKELATLREQLAEREAFISLIKSSHEKDWVDTDGDVKWLIELPMTDHEHEQFLAVIARQEGGAP